MKKVLLMTDYSAAAEKAINYALTMLDDTPCEFTIFNAYGVVSSPSDVSVFVEDELRKSARTRLTKYKNKLAKENNTPYHTFKIEVLGTSPESAAFILHQQHNYDLVVVGATGAGNNLFLGSVATNIVRNLETNTLVVPVNEPIHKIDKIALAVDYQGVSSFDIYDLLKDVTARKNAEITLLTVLKENQKPSDLDSFVKYEYHDYFKEVKTFDYFIKDKDVEEGLKNYLDNHNVDLFALVTRHHSFYDVVFNRSVARKLAYKPTVPLLCIYDKKVDDFLIDSHSEELIAY